MQALRHLRQISQEISQPNVTGWGRRPAALRALSQKLSKYVHFSTRHNLQCMCSSRLILNRWQSNIFYCLGDLMRLLMDLLMKDGLCWKVMALMMLPSL